jgi:hypothetical protein
VALFLLDMALARILLFQISFDDLFQGLVNFFLDTYADALETHSCLQKVLLELI